MFDLILVIVHHPVPGTNPLVNSLVLSGSLEFENVLGIGVVVSEGGVDVDVTHPMLYFSTHVFHYFYSRGRVQIVEGMGNRVASP